MNRAVKAVVTVGAGAAVLISLPGTASADLAQNQKDQMLAQHNRYRAEVGTPALRWDNTIAASAQNYANRLLPGVQANIKTGLVHDRNTPYGENLYGAQSYGQGATAPDPLGALSSWYAEKAQYDANPQPVSDPVQSWGHYSQMVWRTTQRLGCGAASGSQDIPGSPNAKKWTTVVVCRYDPRGNIVGQKPY
jgi:pathogenesis-related protein 1